MSAAQDASSLLNMGTTKKYEIPLAHLDYKYIEECSDVKYLEKILRILRSGEEGRYPEMERLCEDKIEKLNPTSRILRKEIPVRKINEIERTEGQSLQTDLQNWTSEMKVAEGSVNGGSEFDDDSLPPIRSGAISVSGNSTQQEKKSSKKNVMPRSYKEWDKFDVDKEVEEVDKEKPKQPGKSAAQPVIENVINSTGMSEREKEMKANREKDKGNEAFRAGDFQEAITYYSRSISLQPNPPSYNNRALAYLKTKEWMKAESDCNKVLSWEPQNIKALLRRGTAQKGKKCFREALADFQLVLELEPNNKRAEELIQELYKEEKKCEEEKKAKKEKGRRMVIEEVGEEEEEEKTRKGRKVVIEEVEEEEEESADEEIVVEEKKSFEKKKATVSIKSQELNKTKSTETNKKENKPMVNGFHKSPKQKSDSKDIWEEEEVSTRDKEGFTTLRTRPEDKNVNNIESESKNIGESSSTDTRPGQSVQQTESSGLSLQEIENSENENIANASVESNRVEEEPSEKTASHEAVVSSAVVEKPPEELAPVRPVFIKYPLPSLIAKLREEGNKLFREGQYGEADLKYTEALNRLAKEKSDQVVNTSLIHSNRAACHIKTGNCAAAIKDCTTALELMPHSIKPLLRRGNAYEILENYRKAYIDYKHALNIDNTIDVAHQGSSRCQSHLQTVDGSRWRDKLPRIPSVLPWEIPDIQTPEEAAGSSSTSSVPPSSPKCSPTSSVSSSQTQPSSSSSTSSATTSTPDIATSDSTMKPAKEESFEEVKSRGNECVKKSEFKSAIECYTRCVELDPKQAVSYTNRALCYIRVNQPEKAEQDCTTALSLEQDNVKALFRRAQAKKMLKRYKDSLSDLVHLQKVDPKNTAAQREIELVKDYWRQELKSRPTHSPSSSGSNEKEAKSANENKTSKVKSQPSSNVKSAQVGAGSKPSAPKASHQESSHIEEKSNSKTGKQKTRKRMFIEEVDSEEKQSDGKKEIEKEAPNPSHPSGVKHATHKQESAHKSGHGTPTSPTPSHQTNVPPAEPQVHSESKSKKKGKKNKATVEQSSARPTETVSSSNKATVEQSSARPTEAVSSSKEKSSAASPKSPAVEKSATSTNPAQKSSIKATSTGLPVVPQTAPRLEKATPYEFIQAWNSLRNVSELQPYADLLKQIPPKDLPQVISNKLDGGMLNKITKCVAEKFIKQGDRDLSYSILFHLTKVPRFSTISMFLSPNEKKDIQSVMSHLQQSASSQYSTEDLSRLKEDYGV